MLVLFLLIHTVFGRDTQLDNPVFRNDSSCPKVGYFLSRQPGENLTGEHCYLCFCEDDGVEMCWSHHNWRCDSKNYVHDRRLRSRRSPGFADLFFQDAARDVFKKQTPEECKPFQSSYSVGCPPVDWCIGCTVCDCNANGRWDCHVLSFCPGDKGKKGGKKKRTVINAKKMKPTLRNATQRPKPTTKRTLPTKPTAKRTIPSKRPARIYMTVQSKMRGAASTKPTPRRNMPIQSKMKGVLPTKPTTRRTMPKKKRTVPTKPTIKKTIQTKPAVKRTMKKRPAFKTTIETKPADKRTATKKAEKNTAVNKLNKVRQISVIPQNVKQTKIKTNQMMKINTKSRKAVLNKTNNSPPKKLVNSAKPVQKKTLTANVKPALRSFQKVTGKPITNNVNKSKTLTNSTVLVKKSSSKVMKSTDKIVNEKQKKLSKLINITDDEEPLKKTIIKSKFKSQSQSNSTIIEINKKVKEKVILDKKYEVTSKRLKRKK